MDYIGLLTKTFAYYNRKTGISPLLANKDRMTSIRKATVVGNYINTMKTTFEFNFDLN